MSPPARPTIIDVARVAGVTKGTASKALAPNGGRYPVSAATRERVLAAARDLGFAPADKAGKRHDRIALLFMGEAPNLDGINLGLHVALTEHLRRRRLDVVYQSMDRGSDDARRRALARVDGCLLISRTPALEREWDPWLAILAHLPPAVALNAGIRLPIPQIEPDDAGGAARLLDHLVGHGHRRLAMVGRRQQPTPQHGSHHQRHGALMTQARQAGVGLQGSSWAWQVLVTDCEFRGQTRAAALVTSSGLTVVRGTVTEVPVAVEVVAGKSDRLYLGDCRFERITGAVVRADARSQVVMERSTLLDVPTVLDRRSDTTAGMAGGYLLRSLVSGVSLELVGDTTARRAAVVTTPLEPVAVLPPPAVGDLPSFGDPATWTDVRALGVRGDGTSDDTAALRAAIAVHRDLYLPPGRYRLSDTLTLAEHTRLIALHPRSAQLVVAQGTPGFGDPAQPKAVLVTPGGGTNRVTGLGIDPGINPGAVGVRWSAGASSYLGDFWIEWSRTGAIGRSQHTGLWIDGGGGIFRSLTISHLRPPRGLVVSDTQVPGRVYGASLEHKHGTEIHLRNVHGWEFIALQTEHSQGDGPEESLPLLIEDCSRLRFCNTYFYRTSSSTRAGEAAARIVRSRDVAFLGVFSYSNGRFPAHATIDLPTHGFALTERAFARFILPQ